MSRWFRHYAGMARDDKLVRVALRSKQTIERVVWVWCAILESAAEIDNEGRYDFDPFEAAGFLHAAPDELLVIEDSLAAIGYLCAGRVVWAGFSCGEDRNRPPADIWRRLRDFVFRRDDYTCQYCAARAVTLERDHVVPVARGGSHEPENLVTACKPCNRSKGAKTLEEWRN